MTVLLPLAVTQDDVANYVSAVIGVYILIIFIYVVAQLIFSLGGHPPYSRAFNAAMDFLRDVVEPYLRLFRRVLPMLGPFDLSPIVGVIVLIIVRYILTSIITA
jgi:uncharacterized protein YggT (Ycf19 family)